MTVTTCPGHVPPILFFRHQDTNLLKGQVKSGHVRACSVMVHYDLVIIICYDLLPSECTNVSIPNSAPSVNHTSHCHCHHVSVPYNGSVQVAMHLIYVTCPL